MYSITKYYNMPYSSYINMQTTPFLIKEKLDMAKCLLIVIDERRYNNGIVHKMFMMIPH